MIGLDEDFCSTHRERGKNCCIQLYPGNIIKGTVCTYLRWMDLTRIMGSVDPAN